MKKQPSKSTIAINNALSEMGGIELRDILSKLLHAYMATSGNSDRETLEARSGLKNMGPTLTKAGAPLILSELFKSMGNTLYHASDSHRARQTRYSSKSVVEILQKAGPVPVEATRLILTSRDPADDVVIAEALEGFIIAGAKKGVWGDMKKSDTKKLLSVCTKKAALYIHWII